MTAVICFPTNSSGLPSAIIYRADSATDPYTVIDTVSSLRMEYEDLEGDYSKYYAVSFTDGSLDQQGEVIATTKVSVLSVVQNVLNIIRSELDIQEDSIAAASVDFMTAQAKSDIQMDLCTFKYGVEIFSVGDNKAIYKIPLKNYYDLNCAGVVSVLDIEVWKQEKPITIYSPKIKLAPIYIDSRACYVQFAEPCASTDSIKINFYCATRPIPGGVLQRLIAYRICAMHYQNLSIAGSTMNFSSVKIGDISISKGSPNSGAVIMDSHYKMNAKYEKLLQNIRAGFCRAN